MSGDSEKGPRPLGERFLAAHTTALEMLADSVRRGSLVDDRIQDISEVEVGVTPSEVVYEENKLELHRYESLTDEQHEVPILIVYAMVNRPYILDLQPDRSVVRRLLEAGHDVYLLDWNEPSRLDQHLTLADYIERYIGNSVDAIRDQRGAEAINILGYCQGGTMSAIYAALYAEKVNALALMAPPLYLDETGGILEHWGGGDHFDPRSLTDTYGNVPGDFLATGFSLMDPISNGISKYIAFYEQLENEDFVENFTRMERWLDESVDLAGEAYAEFLEAVYQGNTLYKGEFTLDGKHVDPADIDMPLLQILGKYDNLVPPGASKPFNEVVGSDHVTTIEYPTGHVGMAVSRSAHREVWPEVGEWFLDQSDRPALADVLAEGIEETLGVDVETDPTVGSVSDIEVAIADESGDIARDRVARDTPSIAAFFEEKLDVGIELDVAPEECVVTVDTDEGAQTTTVTHAGQAVRAEIQESIADTDVAAGYELEDVSGIGPTYAGRLREAGIDTVAALAVADPKEVGEEIDANRSLAETLIGRARSLSGVDES